MDNLQLINGLWQNGKSQVDGVWQVKDMSPVTFMWADNMQFLRWMKSEMMMGYFHYGIVDPPYGINVGEMRLGANKEGMARRDFEAGEWDGEVPTQEYWDLLRYVCRNLIVWGGNYFTKELDWAGRGFYVWDKRTNGRSFADGELALTDMDFSARIIPKSRHLEKDDGKRRHPTQKPSYLYEYLHEQHEMKGKRVLDTHGGSFSHAISTIRTKVLLTIMDKEKSYCKSGIAAYEENLMTPKLF